MKDPLFGSPHYFMPLERTDGARSLIGMLTAVADLGKGSGPPLFLDQTEARRAENIFLETAPPAYLRFWMTGPHLSHGLEPALNCSRTRQTRRSINDLSVGPLPLSLIDPQMSEYRRQINVVSVTLLLLVSNPANQICWNGVSSDEIRFFSSGFSCAFCACQKVMYSQQVTHGLLHLQYPGSRKWRQSTFFKFWPRLFKRWIALSKG